MLSLLKACCVGGSKCRALPLYAVKLTKARAILISPMQDVVRAIRSIHARCHSGFVPAREFVPGERIYASGIVPVF